MRVGILVIVAVQVIEAVMLAVNVGLTLTSSVCSETGDVEFGIAVLVGMVFGMSSVEVGVGELCCVMVAVFFNLTGKDRLCVADGLRVEVAGGGVFKIPGLQPYTPTMMKENNRKTAM